MSIFVCSLCQAAGIIGVRVYSGESTPLDVTLIIVTGFEGSHRHCEPKDMLSEDSSV